MTDGDSKVKFVSVGLTPPARDMLSATTLQLTTPAGRRISMSTALLAILAEVNLEQVAARIRGERPTTENPQTEANNEEPGRG